MALKAPVAPGIISAVQGVADAFVQASLLTGLQARQAYNLRGIAYQFVSSMVALNGARFQFALSRRSKVAMPNISDIDVISLEDQQYKFTTSGAAMIKQSGYITLPADTPIVEDLIYLQLDTDATAVVNTLVVRLDWEIDTISDIDRLNLIARSLT